MTTENKISRLAGLPYLIVVVTGIFCLAYVPSQITIAGDFQATASNIISSDSLFRFGIASFMIMQVAFLLLPLVLFQLFRTVNHFCDRTYGRARGRERTNRTGQLGKQT